MKRHREAHGPGRAERDAAYRALPPVGANPRCLTFYGRVLGRRRAGECSRRLRVRADRAQRAARRRDAAARRERGWLAALARACRELLRQVAVLVEVARRFAVREGLACPEEFR